MANKVKDDTSFLQGKCFYMCPLSEVKLRQRENLVHCLEARINQSGERSKNADPQRMVKEFSRSAAGNVINSTDVRPLPVLAKTVRYLISSVCSEENIEWVKVYEFVNDRLRAVRQDVVVQGLDGTAVTSLYEPMVRFYVYSQYRLCETELFEFDPHLNLKHLNEVLLTLLSIYRKLGSVFEVEKLDYELSNLNIKSSDYYSDEENSQPEVETSFSNVGSGICSLADEDRATSLNHNSDLCEDKDINDSREFPPYTNIRVQDDFYFEEEEVLTTALPVRNLSFKNISKREEIETIYLLVNLNNNSTLTHALNLPKEIKNGPLICESLRCCLSWKNGSHISLMRLFSILPPIHACALHINLAPIQRQVLGMLSVSHSCKNVVYNTEDLQSCLHIVPSLIREVCTYYGLEVTDQGIKFHKTSFNWKADVFGPKRIDWLDQKLNEVPISQLLM